MDILELLRRWQAGESQRQIAAHTGFARDTVAEYLAAATDLGLARNGPVPGDDHLTALVRLGATTPVVAAPAPTDARLAAYREQIDAWLHRNRLQLTRIQELLRICWEVSSRPYPCTVRRREAIYPRCSCMIQMDYEPVG